MANAAHADKGGGLRGQMGVWGAHARGGGGDARRCRAEKEKEGGGAHANTVCSAPPLSLPVWVQKPGAGERSSPLCMWQACHETMARGVTLLESVVLGVELCIIP